MKRTLLSLIGITLASISYGQSWLDYYDSAQQYWEKDWLKSSQLLHKSSSLCRTEVGIQNRTYAVLLNDLAISESNLNNYILADSLMTESLKLKRLLLGRHNDNYLTGSLNLAEMRIESGDLIHAEKVYRELHNLYKKDTVSLKKQYQASLRGFSHYYAAIGNFKLAEEYLKEVSELLKRDHRVKSAEYAEVLRSMGDIQTQRGQYFDAVELITSSISIYENLLQKDEQGYLRSLNSLGVLFLSSGQVQDAEPVFLKVKKLQEDQEDIMTIEYAEVLNNLASLYQMLGNLPKASSHFKRAITLYKRLLGESSREYAAIINNQAAFFTLIKDYSSADSLYQISLDITERTFGRNHPLFSQSLNNIATLNRKFGEYQKAESYYKEALKIAEHTVGKESPAYATTLGNMGLLYFSMGSYKKSESAYLKSLTIQQKVLNPSHPDIAKTQNNLAILYYVQKDNVKAKNYFAAALSNQINQINTIFPNLSDQEKSDFYATLKLDIERFNAFSIATYESDTGSVETLFNNQLKTKAILLNNLNKIRRSILNSGDDSLNYQFNRWVELREQVADYYHFTKEEIKESSISIDQIQQKANEIEKYLSIQSELFSSSDLLHEVSWQDIQKQLKPDEAAIEILRIHPFEIQTDTTYINNEEKLSFSYGFSNQVWYAFLILKGGESINPPELVTIDYGNDLESRLYHYYSKTIKYQMTDELSYKMFWEPIKKHLSGIKRVYLSPDGVYHKVNLNAILNPKSGSYIIDELDIELVTNTRDLQHRNLSSEQAARTAFLLGNPQFDQVHTADSLKESNISINKLPGSENEVNAIHRILKSNGWNSTKLIAQEAQEVALRNMNNPGILHMATHGFFSANEVSARNFSAAIDDPLFNSGLLLSGAENTFNGHITSRQNDGILTAYEAMNLRLEHTELVVLSACETGLGTIKNGEGVYGLQRAIKVAGADAIIFSLWKVDDEATTTLFTSFYENWQTGMTKRTAFREAQLTLRNQYPEPFYWAGFNFIGE